MPRIPQNGTNTSESGIFTSSCLQLRTNAPDKCTVVITLLRRFFSPVINFSKYLFWWYCLHVNGPLANFFIYITSSGKKLCTAAQYYYYYTLYTLPPIAFRGGFFSLETTLQLLKISLKDIAFVWKFFYCLKICDGLTKLPYLTTTDSKSGNTANTEGDLAPNCVS